MIVSPLTGISMEQTFPLLKLPPELRHIVYEPLIQAGDLSILRVSKLISQEAALFLPKAGTFRIGIDREVDRRTNNPLTSFTLLCRHPMIAPPCIQNLDMRINLVHLRRLVVDKRIITYFSGNEIARRSCKITILVRPHGLNIKRLIYRDIASLTGFKVLTLKVEYRENKDHEAEVLGYIYPQLLIPDQNVLHEKPLKDYEEVSRLLATNLGPAQLNDSLEGPYLSFKPSVQSPEHGLTVDG